MELANPFGNRYYFTHTPKGKNEYWPLFSTKAIKPVILNNAIEYVILKHLVDSIKNNESGEITRNMVIDIRREFDDLVGDKYIRSK